MRSANSARVLFVSCVAAIVTTCGSPSSPTAAPPDVRGSWTNVSANGAAWQWTQTYATASPGATTSTACKGALDVTSQNGSTFSGRFAIDCAAGQSSGAVRDGQIKADGHISFRLVAEEGPDPGVPVVWAGFASCRVTDPQTYDGSLTGANTISADRIQFMDCPEGRVQVTASFSGTHR